MFNSNGIVTFDKDTQLITIDGFRHDYPTELADVSDADLLRHLIKWGRKNGFRIQFHDDVLGFNPEILGFWNPTMMNISSKNSL